MKTILKWLAGAIAMQICFAGNAKAFSTGIPGFSGKQADLFCTSCHMDGTAPEVLLEQVEPGVISPGTMATFRFTITSKRTQQKAAGLNVAASAGALAVIAGQGTKLLTPTQMLPEITHISPKSNDDNRQAAWLFTWQAPSTPGTYTLFAAGNSVNLDNSERTGDNATKTTLQVEVVAAPDTATPTASPTLSLTPTPTSEPTDTPTASPTATDTAIADTPTATPTEFGLPSPTATATEVFVSMCTGDCDRSDDVTVDEIVRGVNIALGSQAVSECEAFDRNLDQMVTVDEIVEAIQRALNGCIQP